MSEHEHEEKKSHGGHGGGGHGGGGSHEEHEGAPEWLISFADNVTLMMGFFVILLAMNLKPASGGGAPGAEGASQPTPELLDTAIAIRQAFNNPVDPDSMNPMDLPLIERMRARRGDSEALREGPKGREHDIRSVRRGDFSGMGVSVPFDTGQPQITTEGTELIEALLPNIKGRNQVLDIRGHASAAESFGVDDRGMALSYDRARTIAEALVAAGIPWNRIRLIACADSERIVPVTYEAAGHRRNQRVEIVMTDSIVREPTPDESATTPAEPQH